MSKPRLYGLDLFRIISAAVVFMFHTVNSGCNYGFLQGFIKNGYVLMTGFFVLSGYVLYYVYQKKDFSKIGVIVSFFKKRLLGILPTYYVAAIIYVLLFSKESIFQNCLLFPIELLGLQSVFSSLFSYSHNGGTWFISCILICYFIFPFLQIICNQISLKIKVLVLAILVFILFFSPIIVHYFSLADIYSNPFFRIIEFSIGVMLSSIQKESLPKNFANVFFSKVSIVFESLILIFAIQFCYWIDFSQANNMMISAVSLIPTMLIIYGLGNNSGGELLNNRFVHYLSELTYSFYLAQLFFVRVSNILLKSFALPNAIKILVMLLICVLISVALHELIEKPCNKLCKKICKRS